MSLARRLPRFRRAYDALHVLADREMWSRDAIETYQLERLNEIWADAVVHVAHYRELQNEINLPLRFQSLDEYRALMPLLTKAEVRDHGERFRSSTAGEGAWRRTGGSTGMPTRIFWADDAHLLMLQSKYRHKQQWGLDIFDREAYLWGHSSQFAPGIAGHIARVRQPLEDRLRQRLRLSAYDLDRDSLRDNLKRLVAFQPRSIYAYPSACEQLTIEAKRQGIRLESLRVVILTGEPAFPHIVAEIEEHFGVPTIVEYGSHECGVTAQEWPDRTLRVREDQVLVETLPRSDGRWDIILSPLVNPSFPLMRYAIEDATDDPLRVPEEGFAIMSNVAGRNNDILVRRDGGVVHPSRFDAFFKYEVPGVRRFQVNQNTDGALTVTLIFDDDATPPDLDLARAKIEALVAGFPVTVERVEELPRSSAGKHRVIVSALTSDGAIRLRGEAASISVEPGTATPTNRVRPETGTKARRLRELIESPELAFLMEAHNGLSAKIAEEAGFQAIWASGLSISAALGVRDCNEASWTQVLEVLEFMSDATSIPILVDGDTGYGNFNNMRRLVQKLEQRDIAGVCIEDKLFPKTNSFIKGSTQPLANVEEFCGRIRAGCDARRSSEFVIVARVEAFIAGWGLDEALRRAEAYRQAGADAILMHSAKRTAHEVISFKRKWGARLPVVIVPTKYYSTPTDVFAEEGFGAVIWANHLMRSSISAMQRTATEIHDSRSIAGIEDQVAPIGEVFRIQGADELAEAEKRYLPATGETVRAIVLAGARGESFGSMTSSLPLCMLPMSGRPLLASIVSAYRGAGVRDITAVRGFGKEHVTLDGIAYIDDDEHESHDIAHALRLALDRETGAMMISPADVLFKKHVAEQLMDVAADFVIAVDPRRLPSADSRANIGAVVCSEPRRSGAFFNEVRVTSVGMPAEPDATGGTWIGLMKTSKEGTTNLRSVLASMHDGGRLGSASLSDVLAEVVATGHDVRVIYTSGGWHAIERLEDLLGGDRFS